VRGLIGGVETVMAKVMKTGKSVRAHKNYLLVKGHVPVGQEEDVFFPIENEPS